MNRTGPLKPIKDLFSEESDRYAKYRPVYPDELFHFISSMSNHHYTALDCATGNGQVAEGISTFFDEIFAIDISQDQLNYASKRPNITYSVQRAEDTSFPSSQFDLITVAQALHWFDLPSFFAEAKRSLKTDGILAIWAYSTFSSDDPVINHQIDELYNGTLSGFWDEARTMVENGYANIQPVGFSEIQTTTNFKIAVEWDLNQLFGYLRTWSAVKKYIRRNGKDPLNGLVEFFNSYELDSPIDFNFPIHLRIFRSSD